MTPEREPETRTPGQITSTRRKVLGSLGTKVIKIRGVRGTRRRRR